MSDPGRDRCQAVPRLRCTERWARDEHGGVRMIAMVTGTAGQPEPSRRRLSGLSRAIVVIASVLAAWLIIGVLRSEAVARDYFAHAHGTGATVVNVDVEFKAPAIPPFWVASISGDVIEAGGTSPVYRSAMVLVVEPFTGWVVVFGAG